MSAVKKWQLAFTLLQLAVVALANATGSVSYNFTGSVYQASDTDPPPGYTGFEKVYGTITIDYSSLSAAQTAQLGNLDGWTITTKGVNANDLGTGLVPLLFSVTVKAVGDSGGGGSLVYDPGADQDGSTTSAGKLERYDLVDTFFKVTSNSGSNEEGYTASLSLTSFDDVPAYLSNGFPNFQLDHQIAQLELDAVGHGKNGTLGISLLTVIPATPLGISCPQSLAQQDVVYGSALSASGGFPNYTYSIVSGSLPSGLAANVATGAITGTPTDPGTYSFVARVQDASGGGVESSCTVKVNPAPPKPKLSVDSTDVPANATVMLTWSAFPGATFCTASGAWSGVLPTSGTRSSAPLKAGSYQFALTCTGAGASSMTQQSVSVYVPGLLDYEGIAINAGNVSGVVSAGAVAPAGGLDGHGYAYSNQALHSEVTAFGEIFDLNEGISSQTVPLSHDQLANLTILAAGVNGNQLNQTFMVTYSDGTSSALKQSLSDWHHPQTYTGESIAAAMNYRITPTGTKESGVFDLYAYRLPLDSSKIATSLKLPANRNVVVLGINETLATQSLSKSLASAFNIDGIATRGQAPRTGGLDTHGYAFESDLLPSNFSLSGRQFRLGAADQLSAVANATIALSPAYTDSVTILAAGVNGNQPAQAFLVTYLDGSTTTFRQDVSDWHHPQNYAGESIALSSGYRVTPTGTREAGIWDLYAYTFQTDPTKPIARLTLPKNRNVVVLAISSLSR